MTQQININEQITGFLVGNTLGTGYLPTILSQIYVVPIGGVQNLNIFFNNENLSVQQITGLSVKRFVDGIITQVFTLELDAPNGKGIFSISALSVGDIILGVSTSANSVKFLIVGLTR